MPRIERLWYDEGVTARALRALLAPASWGFAGVTAVRATLAIVTRKTASLGAAEEIAASLRRKFRRLGTAVVHLAPTELVNAIDGTRRPLAWVAGRRLVAIAAVGDPAAFFAQLESLGA